MFRAPTITITLLLAMYAGSGCATIRPGNLGEYLKGEEARAKPIENQLALARLCERRGELDQARSIYEGVLKETPQQAVALHRLAVVSTRQDRFEEAKSLFAEAAKLQPKSAEIASDRGYLLLLETDYAGAEQCFRRATELKPSYAAAWTNLGLALAYQEKYDEAFAVFLRGSNSPAHAHCSLAFVYAQQSKLTDAQLHYRRALVDDPTLKIAAEGLLQVSARIPGEEPRTVVSAQAISVQRQPDPLEENVATTSGPIPHPLPIADPLPLSAENRSDFSQPPR